MLLPTEHGGWSLALEPVLLGLLIARSWSGLALGLAAMAAFVARTPLKLVLVDCWRHRWLDRTWLAVQVLAVEAAVLALLIGLAIAGATTGFWLPFLLAVPLVLLELWFDMRSRSRRLIPELAGTVAIGSFAAAIALAGGQPRAVAWGLWCVVAARSVAAIPYVRTQVFRGRGRPYRRWHSDLAQLAGPLAVTVGWLADAVPLAAVLAIAVLAFINIVAVRLRPRPAVAIGLQQMFFGLTVTVVTAVAVLAT